MSFWQSIKMQLLGQGVLSRGSEKQLPLILTVKVVAINPHPNADRLRLVTVSTGSSEISPVVCGATNFRVGDIAALALPGAHIPKNIHSDAHESFILAKAVIRGVESQGMLCSGFELGLRDTPETREEGILVYPPDTALGNDAIDVFHELK